MEKKYDLLVIGWGKAGKTLADKVSASGKKVAIIEENPNMYGGTCINVGCLPTKSLVHSAKILSQVKKYGIDGDYNFKNDYFVKSMEKKNEMTKKLRNKNYLLLENAENVDVFLGKASFVSNNEVKVKKADGEVVLKAEKIVINTGSVSRTLNIEGADNKNVLTSEGILDLTALPKKLLIIGAGYIGLEFASYFANFGTEVTVFQFDDSFLPREDEDESKIVKETLEKKGVKFLFNTATKKIVANGEDEVKVVYTREGNDSEEVFNKVLVAVGRRPNIDNLGLENTDVKVGKFGEIVVNDELKTDAQNIWAAGDVKGGPQFTYVSLDDFRIILPQILEDKVKRHVSDRVMIPTSTFIDPPYSRVGLNEKEAQRLRIKYTKKFALTMTIPKAHVIDETEGFTKILINENDEIIGASVFNYESHEIINFLALAINQKIKVEVLKNFIYTHPIITESFNDILA